MAKRIAVWIVAVMFFVGVTPIFAENDDKGGPSPSAKAYEHANEHARFKRTEGLKDKEAMKAEKEAEKAAKEAKKREEKAKKEAEKEKKRVEKEAKKQQRVMEKQTRKMGKGKGFGK